MLRVSMFLFVVVMCIIISDVDSSTLLALQHAFFHRVCVAEGFPQTFLGLNKKKHTHSLRNSYNKLLHLKDSESLLYGQSDV